MIVPCDRSSRVWSSASPQGHADQNEGPYGEGHVSILPEVMARDSSATRLVKTRHCGNLEMNDPEKHIDSLVVLRCTAIGPKC